MKYMLDTNICIYAVKRKFDCLAEKLFSQSKKNICISSIVKSEIEYGICKSAVPEKNRWAFEILLQGISILPYDESAAKEYGEIRAALERQGKPIGGNDLLIAAHCRALNYILVTHNLKEFSRVENLEIEDWTVENDSLD